MYIKEYIPQFVFCFVIHASKSFPQIVMQISI